MGAFVLDYGLLMVAGFAAGTFCRLWWLEREARRLAEWRVEAANDLIRSLTGTWRRAWSEPPLKRNLPQ